MDDGVTIKCAADYGRRCQAIGQERRHTADLQEAMNNPKFKARHHQLLDELATEYRENRPILERPAIATINVGTFQTVDELATAANTPLFYRSDWAKGLMRLGFALVGEPATIELYEATTAELGFPAGGSIQDIFAALESIGAVKLPPEAGPQYRIQRSYPTNNHTMFMYMDPIANPGDTPKIFTVGCLDGQTWLGASYASPDFFYGAGSRWIFARKSPTPS